MKAIIMWLIKKFLPGYYLIEYGRFPSHLLEVVDWIRNQKGNGTDQLMKQIIGRVYDWQRHLAKNPPKGKRAPRKKASNIYPVPGE